MQPDVRLTTMRREPRNEDGAIAVMAAMCLTIVLVACAMVLDFGLVRVDRQVDKSAADSATLAGAEVLTTSGTPHPFKAVCAALRYLAANDQRFAGMTDSGPTSHWYQGDGTTAAADGCADPTAQALTCDPTTSAPVKSHWATFTWDGTWQGTKISATIQSGYDLTSAPANSWPEEALPAVAADNADGGQGCYQLAVTITQHRQPGLGSLAGAKDLVTSLRSVARVKSSPGSDAPAMLLLKRTGCPSLQIGAAAGGTHLYVYGAYSLTTGLSQPGTIHADADGNNCPSNKDIFLGNGTNGIVAFAAKKPDGTADTSRPGVISTTAISNGVLPSSAIVSDGYAFGTTAGDESGLPGSAQPIAGRDLVTRSPIDNRYLGDPTHGVTGIVTTANNAFVQISSIASAGQAAAAGYNQYVKCAGGGKITSLPTPMSASDRLFVDCTAGVSQMPPASAGTIAFNGPIKLTGSGTNIDLPNATKVYVAGSSSDGVNMGSNAFKMHYLGNTVGSSCSNSQSPTAADRALLVIQNGTLSESNGGTFQACYTSVIMMSGQGNGCLPTTPGTAPTQFPCAGVAGSGLLQQSGGATDWTAPNSLDATLDSSGNPLPGSQQAWWNVDGPEDLAFWSEAYGTSSDWTMNGQSTMHLVGVVMVPNADPFRIAGGSCQTLTNAQYIATSILVNNTNACIKMQVDPNSVVTLPQLGLVGLVR